MTDDHGDLAINLYFKVLEVLKRSEGDQVAQAKAIVSLMEAEGAKSYITGSDRAKLAYISSERVHAASEAARLEGFFSSLDLDAAEIEEYYERQTKQLWKARMELEAANTAFTGLLSSLRRES